MNFSEDFRTDTDKYFELSGIREYKKLTHHPFIVFKENSVIIIKNIAELLLNFDDEIDVIAQWEGTYSSDFFKFKVKELREYIKKNPKASYQII